MHSATATKQSLYVENDKRHALGESRSLNKPEDNHILSNKAGRHTNELINYPTGHECGLIVTTVHLELNSASVSDKL